MGIQFNDRGLTLGDGIFDVVRTIGGPGRKRKLREAAWGRRQGRISGRGVLVHEPPYTIAEFPFPQFPEEWVGSQSL
jgi:hypothetical protein